jgi:hypothetical protein
MCRLWPHSTNAAESAHPPGRVIPASAAAASAEPPTACPLTPPGQPANIAAASYCNTNTYTTCCSLHTIHSATSDHECAGPQPSSEAQPVYKQNLLPPVYCSTASWRWVEEKLEEYHCSAPRRSRLNHREQVRCRHTYIHWLAPPTSNQSGHGCLLLKHASLRRPARPGWGGTTVHTSARRPDRRHDTQPAHTVL